MSRVVKIGDARAQSAVERAVADLSRQPSCLGIVLFGAHVAGVAGAEEPIRLLVISDGRASSKQALELGGYRFDLWNLARKEIAEKIRFHRDIVLIRILMRGKVLFQRGGTVRDLADLAKDTFAEGPKRITNRERDALRLKLSRLLFEVRSVLKRQAYPEAAYLLMNENFLPVIEAHFRANRWWPGGEKFLLSELRNRDPRLYAMALAYLREGDPARKFAAFAKIVGIVLDKLGGPTAEFASRPRFPRGRINMLMNPVFLLEAVYRQVTGREMSLSSRFDAVARFMKFLKPYRLYFIEVTLFGVFMLVLTLPIPFLTQYLFDSVLPHRNFAALYGVVALSALLGIASAVLGFFQHYYASYVEEQMTYDITFHFYRHLFNLSHSFYDEQETGQVIFRFQDATEALLGTVGLVLAGLRYLTYLVVVPVVAFFVRWDLALITAAFIPFTAASYWLQSHYVRKYTRQITAKRAEFTARNYESIAGVKTVLSLGAKDRTLRMLRRTYLELRDRTMRLVAIVGATATTNGIVAAISAAVFMAYAWTQILQGDMTVGELVAFTMLGGILFTPITSLISLGPEIQRTLVRAERFFEIYDIVPDVLDEEGAEEVEGLSGPIEFDNVSFEYEMGRETLADVTVTIQEGETVALVGPSGSGKTTFVSLIPRFYDATAGEIRIGGKNIRKVTIRSLRRHIGFVPQEDFVFAGTVRENILLGKCSATDGEMIQAARAARLHDVVMELPLRYDTPVGEAGARFSGGEKKRLSLARILVRDPEVLILDEATSELDPENERLVLEALREVRKNRTTIIIAHRLSTVREADRILVFDEGRIVEEGRHEELYRPGTRYYELFEGSARI